MNDEQMIWEAYQNLNDDYVYRGMSGKYLDEVRKYGLHTKTPTNHDYNELTWPEFSKWQTKWERQNKYEDWEDFIENTKGFPMAAIEARLYVTPDEDEANGYAEMNDDPVLLRINKTIASWKICPKPFNNHWYTYSSIPPQNIEIRKDNNWVPIVSETK